RRRGVIGASPALHADGFQHEDAPLKGRAFGGADAAHLATVWRDFCRRLGEAGMSRFSAEWLAIRERHDLAARNPSVLDAVVDSLRSRSAVRVLDLACGSGSTVRALHTRFPSRQHWDLVDNDPDLLTIARDGAADKGITLNTVRLDLNRDVERALDA